MEKEKILSTFHDKLGKTNLSNRTIETYIDCNPLSEGQEPDEAYWESGLKMLKALDGQFNHDVATKVEDFKKNYKPDTEIPTAKVKTEPDVVDNSVIAELQKKVEELTKQIGESQKKVERERLLKEVRAEMRSQKADDEYVLDKTLEHAELDASKSAKDLATELMKKYNVEYTACRGKGVAPRTALGGSSGNGGKSVTDDFFAKKKKREGWDNK